MKRIKNLKSRSIGHHGIEDTATVADAAREFLATRVSALIVYDVDKMVGIFTKNDLVRTCAKHPDGIATLKVGQCMKMDVYTTTPDANLDDVAAAMIEKGFRHVPVLEADKVVGMVTHIDILLFERELLTEENMNLMRYVQGSY